MLSPLENKGFTYLLFRGVLLILIIVGQGPTVVAVGAGEGCLVILILSVFPLFFLPLSGRRSDIG